MQYFPTFGITVILTMSISTAIAQTEIPFPKGWHPANRSDYSTEDLSFLNSRVPNHIDADFNGDDREDSAWILLKDTGEAWGLFAFIKKDDNNIEVIKLDENKKETEKLYMGISILSPGKHRTACGKGYFDCTFGEPEILDLKYSGIDYFLFESANSVFYWDDKTNSFKRVWLSD